MGNKSINANIQQAVVYLRAGKLVAFPTETVYGLGADAQNVIAINKVFTVKGRPSNHPLIVHISNIAELDQWAINIPNEAYILAQHFWPGPCTLILQKHHNVAPEVTGYQPTIALRIPRHPIALELLRQFGSGIVGPSANTYGHISPTTAEHVIHDFNHHIDYILDGGHCELGIESSIFCFSDNKPSMLRQGSITLTDVSRILGYPIFYKSLTNSSRVPGSLSSHYAPKCPLYLVNKLDFLPLIQSLINKVETYSVLSFSPPPFNFNNLHWIQAPSDPKQYAKLLYGVLRKLDLPQSHVILVEDVPKHTGWLAIADRLQRASHGNLNMNMLDKGQ